MNEVFLILLVSFCLLFVSLYFYMLVVRPIRIRLLANKYRLSYKWVEIRKTKSLFWIYEVKKNILTNKSKKLIIYDTSILHDTPQEVYKFPYRQTVAYVDNKRHVLRDRLLGYAKTSKIEAFIVEHL